ncbi:hypothetical protein [Candidatus Neptunochlamydia vexilliferae]|uniref:Uncharacterized protein n=1 Tax=Candidatus Neptunichlamydia vexilliferae TaxID=1651774 RepID=A0ABS0AYL5_9BACT|nr:hypothetical protein [Candidatus Neptunochlamydia vexilliferae]MBF5059223.1 hypothetical protein [Candidatus Neptunochlamydia vexilliferae]
MSSVNNNSGGLLNWLFSFFGIECRAKPSSYSGVSILNDFSDDEITKNTSEIGTNIIINVSSEDESKNTSLANITSTPPPNKQLSNNSHLNLNLSPINLSSTFSKSSECLSPTKADKTNLNSGSIKINLTSSLNKRPPTPVGSPSSLINSSLLLNESSVDQNDTFSYNSSFNDASSFAADSDNDGFNTSGGF